MRRAVAVALACVALGPGATLDARAAARTHRVSAGQTLGRIARRYGVTVDALRRANALQPRAPLRVGQRLVIPEPGADPPPDAPAPRAGPAPAPEPLPAPEALPVPGTAPASYYAPTGPGRLGLRPVIVYLHGRGGHPAADCRRWATLARNLGWVLCPSGQEDRGEGARGWNNDWPSAQRVVLAALAALREKHGRRVQLRGNTLVGFSEGAYVAMNVGVRNPRTFNRWLILAADSKYWGGPGVEALGEARGAVKRVYLITGAEDGVYEGTLQVRRWLQQAKIPTRASLPEDMGHEVPLERRAAMYRAALWWLDRAG